jgi:ABC-type Fe3+/spermidine/putrescine transport system ATPase subunit
MMEYLIGKDLSFCYDGEPVLRGVDVCVSPGKASVLVGPNGSGKTTLLWLLGGLLSPTTGCVGLSQSPPPTDAPLDPVNHKRTPIGMVFQSSGLWDHLSVERHLKLVLGGKGLTRAERRRRIDRTLSRMRLQTLRKRRPGQLSGGERQRLAIARALVIEPQWVLLDEPLAHLDGAIRRELFELLREVLTETRSGVLLATHNPTEALRLGDEVLILLDGRVVQSGPPAEVYRSPVTLQAGRVLGPTSELRGDAENGALRYEGAVVLEDLDPDLTGSTRLVLHPEDVAFHPESGGAGVVRRCEFVMGSYHLYVEVGGTEIAVLHKQRVAPGTHGRLRIVGGHPSGSGS